MQVIFSKIPYTNLKIGTVIKGCKPSKQILAALKDLAKIENAIIIKLEPNVTVNCHPKRSRQDGRVEGSQTYKILR